METSARKKAPQKERPIIPCRIHVANVKPTPMREQTVYDRTVTARDVSMTSRSQRSPGSTVKIIPDYSQDISRGLCILAYNLQIKYEKARNLREAERLQEEIARREDRGFEI